MRIRMRAPSMFTSRWITSLLLLVLAAVPTSLAQVGPVRIHVSASPGTVTAGDAIQCAADKTFFRNPGVGQPVGAVWSSLSPAVATVDSTGLVTTHSQGTTLIVAASGPFRGSVSVSATAPVLRSIEVLPQVPSI